MQQSSEFINTVKEEKKNQKLIEIAPSPQIADELRHKLGQLAVEAARAVGYESAGTVEFLLVDEDIYKTHSKGFIGLQVHGIKKGTGPFEVSWKNIKIKEL